MAWGFAPGRSLGAGNAKSGGREMFWKRPFTIGGCASTAANLRGPWTSVSLQTTFFIASSGFTQGPAVSLQPPEAAIAISRPNRSASAPAWWSASFQSGVIHTSRLSTNCGVARLPSNICMPAMPTRCIHSRSAVMPSLVTLPFIQCHQIRGLAESGGCSKPSSKSPPAPVEFWPGAARIMPISITASKQLRTALRTFLIRGASL